MLKFIIPHVFTLIHFFSISCRAVKVHPLWCGLPLTNKTFIFLIFSEMMYCIMTKKARKVLSFPAFLWASCRIRTNDPEITNHVLWPTELKRQMGKLATSRRYNQVPLLRSSPGGFRGSLPCRTYPTAKVDIISEFARAFFILSLVFSISDWNIKYYIYVKMCIAIIAYGLCWIFRASKILWNISVLG